MGLRALVAALWLTACGSSTVITGIEGEPDAQALATADLTLVSGDNQDAVVGEAAPEPLTVRITDAAGAPMAGAPVHWIFTHGSAQGAGGSSADSVSTTSDSEGEASVTWVLGERAGTQTAIAQIVVPATPAGSAPAAANVRERTSFRANARHSAPRTVDVTPNSVSMSEGNTMMLDATVADRFGNPVPDPDLTWSSRDPSIASIGADTGELTAMAEGTTTVVAQYRNLSGESSVGVTAEPDTLPDPDPDPDPVVASIEIRRVGAATAVRALSLSIGQTVPLEAIGLNAAGDDLGAVGAVWSSSDALAATVSLTGSVHAVAAGSSRLTAEFEGHTASADVTVHATSADRVFSSDWSTGTGGSISALRDADNDGWDATICSHHGLLEVIAPGALPSAFGDAPPSTTTGNVLRTEYSNDGSCGNVEVHLDGPGELPPGQDYWVRYYLRVDPGVHSRGVAHYETVSVFDYRNLTFNSPLANGMGDQWSPVPRMESAEYPFGRWEGGYDASRNRTQLLDDGAWYRLEFHVEFLADSNDPGPTGGTHRGPHGSWVSENADCEFRLWPRVYDADGNLVLDASNFGQQDFGVASVAPHGSRWTLQEYYDAGYTYLCNNRSLGSGLRSMQYLGIGNNGATQGASPASNGSQYFYYMNFAVSTAGWIGSTP